MCRVTIDDYGQKIDAFQLEKWMEIKSTWSEDKVTKVKDEIKEG